MGTKMPNKKTLSPKKGLEKIDLEDQLLTVEDVADYLQLKAETIRLMARKKKIPALKIGKVWRFRSIDIKMLGR